MELGLKRRINSNSSEVDEKKLGHRLQVRAGGNAAVLTGRKKLTHRTTECTKAASNFYYPFLPSFL